MAPASSLMLFTAKSLYSTTPPSCRTSTSGGAAAASGEARPPAAAATPSPLFRAKAAPMVGCPAGATELLAFLGAMRSGEAPFVASRSVRYSCHVIIRDAPSTAAPCLSQCRVLVGAERRACCAARRGRACRRSGGRRGATPPRRLLPRRLAAGAQRTAAASSPPGASSSRWMRGRHAPRRPASHGAMQPSSRLNSPGARRSRAAAALTRHAAGQAAGRLRAAAQGAELRAAGRGGCSQGASRSARRKRFRAPLPSHFLFFVPRICAQQTRADASDTLHAANPQFLEANDADTARAATAYVTSVAWRTRCGLDRPLAASAVPFEPLLLETCVSVASAAR